LPRIRKPRFVISEHAADLPRHPQLIVENFPDRDKCLNTATRIDDLDDRLKEPFSRRRLVIDY
jgi:hypothetical protein